MKFKTLFTLTAVAAMLAIGFTAQAQTNNTLPTIGGLISTFSAWVSSFDTNLSYQDFIVWDGPVYQKNVNIMNEFGASYDVWRQKISTNNTSLASVGNKLGGQLFLAPEGRFRQANIAGDWVSMGAGLEFGWMKYDFRSGVFVDGVYLNNPEALGRPHSERETAEFGLFADKMINKATAAGIFISDQVHQSAPFFGVNLNVSFGSGTGLFGLF